MLFRSTAIAQDVKGKVQDSLQVFGNLHSGLEQLALSWNSSKKDAGTVHKAVEDLKKFHHSLVELSELTRVAEALRKKD